MSLEQAITENTEALWALIEEIKGQPGLYGAKTSTSTPDTPAPKTTGKTPSKEKTTEAAPAEAEDAPEAAPAEAEDAPDYNRDDLKRLTLQLVAKDKSEAVAILAKYGAKKAPEVKDEDLNACCADMKMALEG